MCTELCQREVKIAYSVWTQNFAKRTLQVMKAWQGDQQVFFKTIGLIEKIYVPRLAFEDYESVHHYIASSLYCGIIFHNIIFGFLSAFDFTIF